MLLRKRLASLGACCVLHCILGGGALDETHERNFEDTVVLVQKASTAAEGKQFPNMLNPMASMMNPMASMMNPMAAGFMHMMNPMNPMAAPYMARAQPMIGQSLLSQPVQPVMRPRPRAPGFSVVVDSAAGASFKLTQKMDQMGITPAEFYANTVVIDKYGMRVPQDKVPRHDQYPLIYKYTDTFAGRVPPTQLLGQASAPSVRMVPQKSAPTATQMGPPMSPGMGPPMPMPMGMPMAMGMQPMMAPSVAVVRQYEGIWHRVSDADDKFEIRGNLIRWSKQPPESPAMEISWDPSGQITMVKQGVFQTGRLEGFRLLWSDGDVWVRDQKVKTAAEQVFDDVMAYVGGSTGKPMIGNRRERDLAFVHVPSNFDQEIEQAALAIPQPQATPQVDAFSGWSMDLSAQEQPGLEGASPEEPRPEGESPEQLGQEGKGPSGELWGEMLPALREKSAVTGCSLFATPPKHWPAEMSMKYFAYNDRQNRTVIGVLRDPYDKLTNEFRARAAGNAEEDGPMYQKWYDECNVSSWVKEELKKVKDDAFRANCRFLPQAEYFEGPNGVNLPIDGRLMPLSFNEVMERHGYAGIRLNGTTAAGRCEVSAWSLDQEARDMIKDVYARDFVLLCKKFGYCDPDELTCMAHVPSMCGGAPAPEPSPETVAAAEAAAAEAAAAGVAAEEGR